MGAVFRFASTPHSVYRSPGNAYTQDEIRLRHSNNTTHFYYEYKILVDLNKYLSYLVAGLIGGWRR